MARSNYTPKLVLALESVYLIRDVTPVFFNDISGLLSQLAWPITNPIKTNRQPMDGGWCKQLCQFELAPEYEAT
jgi:hypothetical protein